MNRNLMMICLLVGFSIACSLVRGQGGAPKPDVPAPVYGELPHGQSPTTAHFWGAQSAQNSGVLTQPAMLTGPEPVIASTFEMSGVSQPYQHPPLPQAMHSGARAGQLPMSFSLQRAGDDSHCPLRLLHVPYGVWIEIEGAYYQHKSLNNTTDVCVNFEITPSSLQPSVVIRTASNPGEIRQSETSMSRSILLVPGQTVEFDYAREFGEQLRKKLSRSEHGQIARMSHADSDTVGYKRIASAPIVASQEIRPDQISSIQVDQFATSLELSWVGKWDVTPKTKALFTLRGSTRLLSSLAPDVRIKADITVSYVNNKMTFVEQIEGKLGQGRVSDANPGKAEIDCVFDFNTLFNGDSAFAKYIRSARNSGRVECSFADVKLEFYNGQFDRAISNKFDGLVLQPFILQLDLKIPKSST